jgi:hypothetical protein
MFEIVTAVVFMLFILAGAYYILDTFYGGF